MQELKAQISAAAQAQESSTTQAPQLLPRQTEPGYQDKDRFHWFLTRVPSKSAEAVHKPAQE